MSRWFRFYDDAINDPKILKLPETMRWYWTALLCVASKNDGALPALDDIAIQLRVTAAKATEIISILVKATLLDRTAAGFEPHNWSGRQYKSDVSTERVKRFRERERNVSVTAPEQKQTTEQKQSRAESPAADVSTSEKVLRSDLLEAFGPSCALDLSRAGVWLSKGYGHTMIVEAVREVLARGSEVGSLNYFDAMLAERHAGRPETPSERAAAKVDMDKVAEMFKKTGVWSRYAGPEPGMSGCKCPPEILAKHGIVVAGMRRLDA